jgi:murein DD-endopeptidase MepM/ murein hydrolase activator NlpD
VGHRKRKIRYFNFLLIPDNEQKTRSVKIRAWVLRALMALIFVLVVLIILGAASYWKVASLAIGYRGLQEENTKLKSGLARVEELQAEIDKLKKIDQKLRNSLSGYVIVDQKNTDVDETHMLDGMDRHFVDDFDRSIFNFIPEIYPVDGFITRGHESGSLLSETHLGIDIAGAKGSPVKATASGVVLFSGWTYEEGNVIIIKHALDYFSYYKHNLRNLCDEWESVKKGQVIALLGDTGRISSGPHLHFELWQGAEPIDPVTFLRHN